MSDIFDQKKSFEKDYEYGYGSKGNSDADNDGKKEIDCSHLVNSLVRGAGYDVPYQTTEQLNKSNYYDVIDPSEAKSGDILLWRGKHNHTGILDSISYSASPSRFSGTFFGSQSSSGPATAKFGDGAPYWPRPLKVLRPKEKYKTGNAVKTEKSQPENRISTSQFIFPVVNEKGEQYSNADAIYKLLEKETSGFYLLSAHNFWHGGIHFTDVSVPHHIKDQSLRCMMDGKVIAYRLNKNYLTSNWLGNELQYSSSFCLIQHEYESPANTEEGNNKGKKNKLTFYSLYMHLAPYSVYASAADYGEKTKAKNQLKLIQTIRVRRGDDVVKGTPPSLGRLGAGSIVDLNGETSQFTVQEQGGSHSYTFAKGTISKACGKTDSHITEGTCIWVVDSAKYTEHVDQSTANKPCSPPAYWQCKMKGIVKNRVNARQIKDNNQPFSDANSESLGLLNITAEFEFNSNDVVTCSIGGKARKMAKATLLSGGYAEKAGQPPSPFWVCIDESVVELSAQAPTQFDSIVKCNQPIKAGDAIGLMGLYEVPKMPAACRQKVSKHQVHIEIFSTDSDNKIQAFLNNEAGLTTGKQYVKVAAGASVYIREEDKGKVTFSTGGLKTQSEAIAELTVCKKESDSSNGIFYKINQLPILNGTFNGYISEKELAIVSQYDLSKLGFKLLEEQNTNSDGYLDPEKMPAFFRQLYKAIDKDGNNSVDSTEIAAAFKDQSKRNQLVKLVAKHPSEWHKSTINTIKTTFSNWASEATEDETKALMSHEKERMEKLEWMSQITTAPLILGPAVWHLNPITLINYINQLTNGKNWAHSAFGNLLAKVESNGDYSAYNQINNSKLKSFYNTNITTYTLNTLMEKQKTNSDGFREIFAAGRYQIIPDTLKDAVDKLSLSCEEKFSPELQDKVFNEYLIKIKRPNIIKYLEGDGDVEDAIHDWAMEFASAGVRKGREIKSTKKRDSEGRVVFDPVTKKAIYQKRYASFEGESYYNGDGFNVAHIMPDDMVSVLQESKKNGG